MDIIFLIAAIFLIICYINRKKLVVMFGRKKQPSPELPITEKQLHPEVIEYKVLAYNAKDYVTTKDLESNMELRLEQALAGLARQGVRYEVEFHSTGFVLVYLIKYWC